MGCEQFIKIRNNQGPLYGEGSTCPNRDQCIKSAGYDPGSNLKKPDCMPWTPLEFEWRCVTPHDSPSSLLASIFPGKFSFCLIKVFPKILLVGASEMAAGVKGKFNNQSTAVKVSVRINKDKSIDIGNLAMFLDDKWVLTEKEKMLEQVHTSFACVNSILEPEMWEIVNATRGEFENKKLLTFYFLPILLSRHRSVGIMKGRNVGTECNNVKIVFVSFFKGILILKKFLKSRKEYQMLIIGAPSNRTVNQTDEKPFYNGLLHPLPIRGSQTTLKNNDVLTSSKPSKGKFKREIFNKLLKNLL